MDALEFFTYFAVFQCAEARPLAVGEVVEKMAMSRQSIHRHLSRLIKRGFIVKVKRGHYAVKSTYSTQAIGLNVLLPMDVYEYHSVHELNGISKSA